MKAFAMRSKKIVVHNVRNVKIQKHPQMNADERRKNKVTGGVAGYFVGAGLKPAPTPDMPIKD